MLTQLPIDQFITTTASNEPVPGGGSISALCGALASALGQMVSRLTIGRKKYADVQTEIEAILAELEPLTNILTEAVNLDSEAYDQVFRAYKMPKDTDEQKQERDAAIEAAMRHAAEVPLSVSRTCKKMLPLLKTLAQKGNQNAITDAYVATLCARTAILGANANVAINLSSINDSEYVAKTKDELEDIRNFTNRAEDEMTAIMINKDLV